MTNDKPAEDWTQWAWFVGPNEEEFNWGRYASREQAINEGNGFCFDDGQEYFIIEARGCASEPDDEGMIQFAEYRNLEKVLSHDD